MKIEEIFQPSSSIYFVGIKGTGVCALAELMHNFGIKVSGSDTPEIFYTDTILKELNIPYYENFDAVHIHNDIGVVIHSAAYNSVSNPELARAMELNIPVLKYTDALGAWSSRFDSTGICGVHGKTTTTAICGVLMRAAGLPAQILTGSAVADFGGRSSLKLGDKYFIAETCEYRKHFLSFHPKRIILTAVECDHQDFFPDYGSIRNAFVEYCRLLPENGHLIYCADDPGASEVAYIIEKEQRRIKIIPYGFTAAGDYRIVSYNVENEMAVFTLAGFRVKFKLRLPGRHEALNSAAAIALVSLLAKKEFGSSCNESAIENALINFKSAKRRSEIIGETCGIIFMDDYGHHPTAIKATLAGIKSFYPMRRLIVSFMPHTYTRTSALLKEFASAFSNADILFLHKVYASARENYTGGVNGKTLYEKASLARGGKGGEIRYVDEPDDAFDPLCEILKPGDLFITLGAGNNWPLGEKLFAHFKSIDKRGNHHD
ncbi:MAG: UDP-N-acetylmuramate--L-alanine ligase [Treponema sp.]|jgi:UDP-N-acetylmuramate--alanine ligase|nr:UDP-N-acetylmuramate--L-alanine ligase [Treponema sp.]